ncbi:MAG: hypothetical protein IJ326_07725 [Lachnospiraceae bacterium]|nr:hypothetical protein [Lachnospiraceae bacterium]
MVFISILDNRENLQKEEGIPGFIYDLNLDQVIEQIQGQSLVPVKQYFHYLPADKSCEDYRRAVYADVKRAEVNQLLTEFMERMEARKQAIERKSEVGIGMQRAAWMIQEIAAYCEAYTKLYEGLQEATIQSKGLLELRELLKSYTTSEEYTRMQKTALDLREKLQSFRVKLVYEQECLVVEEGEVEGSYERFLQEILGGHTMQMKSPFGNAPEMNSLEKEIVQRFSKKQPAFFKEMRAFYHEYENYENAVLLQFAEEISYYLSYYHFQQSMELKGFVFVTPSVDESKDMSAQGLYDLALACDSIRTGKAVIANDMNYCKGESFLVVTGPNQGGKTTFARSLGQLIYLTKMGLDVPATAANVHSFSGILTHFSVEESVETGRGKLMEELMRLKPMMCENYRNAFVIINELFTTAANYDACIMGKKVLEHFIAQECRGIYVTHLKELTKAHESVVSMRAMVDEQKKQNFKICRYEADDSVCAINQVNKYRLTYEQLKERLR